MIKISNLLIKSSELNSKIPPNSVKRIIIRILSESSETYYYESWEELDFELEMRVNIIGEANALNKSRIRFSTFRDSECNPDYWIRLDNGGFQLKKGVKPSAAINDIFINGKMYGTECATAMVIIFYKAVLDMYGEDRFNEVFSDITLMNWSNLDRDLGISSVRDKGDYLPGDCRYFQNPDVDPLHPEWQGENAIDLGNGRFYGHGIGITSPEIIIQLLNKKRFEGATKSAYLANLATRPYFKHLWRISKKRR